MVFVFGAEHCRVCFVKPKKSRHINDRGEDEEETPIEMMQKITGTELTTYAETLEIPQKICKSCFLSLDLAFQFRRKVLKAQRIINMHLKKQHSLLKQENIVYENEQLLDDLDIVVEQEEQLQHEEEFITNPAEYEAEQKVEGTEDDIMGNEEYLDDFEELEVDYFVDENAKEDLENEQTIIVQEEEEEEQQIAAELEPEPELSAPTQKKEKSIYKFRAHTKTTKVQKSDEEKINYESNKYICDICGNGFEKRARMMEHRRRHTKELIFSCEICDERFHLRENMRRHMFMHRGDRPYKCSYCSRSFYYESVRKTHELVHVGVKPFICDVCSKAFAYSHALKKHQMIHDEVKLFNCEYCKKEFRLQHHLKQHEETRTHQNAVAQALETQGSVIEDYFKNDF